MGMLSGYSVIDFTSFVSGSTCTLLLADMGAEVIRIERSDKKNATVPFAAGNGPVARCVAAEIHNEFL